MTEPLVLDSARQVRARQFARLRRRLLLLDWLLATLVTVVWLVGAWAPGLKQLLSRYTTDEWLMVAAVGAAFFLSFELYSLPLGFYSGFVLPHRFGQSTQSLGGWVKDQLIGAALAAAFGLPLLEATYWLLRTTGQDWWLWAGLSYLGLTVLLSSLAPALLMPLFNKFVPLGPEHAELGQRLQRLAERAGTHISGVFRFDLSRRTRAANAALTGLGSTRRIILGDTLLDEFTAEEIETVMAHELGHHVHRDIPIGIVVSALITLAGLFLAARFLEWSSLALGLAGRADVAALPLLVLALAVFGVISLPLQNAYSRWREVRADQYALQLTGRPQAFANALTRLANQNLAEADPEPWVVFLLYSHPPIRQRLALVVARAPQLQPAPD
ncbi:MAG: M48 family metallopeptidase [Anaerolineales bacterium]|nr:M48 family metallopeptidase [Anaerolineales bacterium]